MTQNDATQGLTLETDVRMPEWGGIEGLTALTKSLAQAHNNDLVRVHTEESSPQIYESNFCRKTVIDSGSEPDVRKELSPCFLGRTKRTVDFNRHSKCLSDLPLIYKPVHS